VASGLAGQVAVVTGAAGGIGAAVCRRMRADGARVWGLDLQISPDLGPGIEYLVVDLTEADSVFDAAAHVQKAVGHVDVVVACAGVVENDVPVAEMSVATFDRIMSVNLRGVFVTCRAFAPAMIERGSGRMVTIASMSGNAVVNMPQRQAAYNASKAAVTALTRSMAVEWAPYGVRVNALSPGYVDTELNASKPHLHDEWRSRTPLGRFASVEEVAAAVSFLVGDEAGFFQGAELLMDGGYSLW
jgi:NAD(P)-dependent dehydrogenase (short-subunit alcohol dehydrogenase family)